MRVVPVTQPLATRPSPRETSLWWPLGSVYVGIALFMLSPHRDDYLATAVTIVSFGLFPILFARSRPVRAKLICPLNWVLLAFFLQLVVVPLLVCFFGPDPFTLPAFPSKAATNIALLLSALSFASFCVGYHVTAARAAARAASPSQPRAWPGPSPGLVALFFALGILGLLLTFHGVNSIFGYFSNSTKSQPDVNASSATKVAGLVLRAFLGFACVAAWCRWIDQRKRWQQPGAAVAGTALAGLAIFVSYGTFSYNRGAFVAPLVALLAVYGVSVRPLRLRWLLVMGVIGIVLLTAFRVYRTSGLTLGHAIRDPQERHQITHHTSVNKELQIYAGGPQFAGFLLDRTDYGRNLHYGKTLFGTAISPVPALGRPFRKSSGVNLYNRLIYGNVDINDQIIPFQGELFINFQLPGVIVAYLLLGLAFQRVQRGFERAPTSLQSFSWQYAATWLAYLVAGGLAPVSQIFVYFFWPIYALAVWSWLRPTGGSAVRTA
jgi:hypothetical protein